MANYKFFDESAETRFAKVLESNGVELQKEAVEDIVATLDAMVFEKMKVVSREIGQSLKKTVQSEIRKGVKAENKKITSKVSDYLDYVVVEWLKQNKADAVRTTQDAINGRALKAVVEALKGNYVEVPEGKENIVSQLSERLVTTESTAVERTRETRALKSMNSDLARRVVIERAAAHLTDTQRERLVSAAEDLDKTSDLNRFAARVKTLRDSMFSDGGNRRTESKTKGGDRLRMRREQRNDRGSHEGGNLNSVIQDSLRVLQA